MTVEKANELAESYLSTLRALGGPATERVVNKSLYNWQHLALIALLFPKARVVHVRRDPVDCCLSVYMNTLDVSRAVYSADLRDIGFVYRQCQRLMAHWKEVLDLPILEIQYEELVAKTAAFTSPTNFPTRFCGGALSASSLNAISCSSCMMLLKASVALTCTSRSGCVIRSSFSAGVTSGKR